MIKITVELYPYGFEESKRTIGEGVIYNDGTGCAQIGHYNASFVETDRDQNKYKSRLEGFDRLQDIWILIRQVLVQMQSTEEVEERVKRHLHSLRDRQNRF